MLYEANDLSALSHIVKPTNFKDIVKPMKNAFEAQHSAWDKDPIPFTVKTKLVIDIYSSLNFDNT